MNVKDFKQSCEVLSAKFIKIDKRSHSINNLRNAVAIHAFLAGGVWLPCCRPGAPCSSRIMVTIESCAAHNGKELLVACSEVKHCLLSVGFK